MASLFCTTSHHHAGQGNAPHGIGRTAYCMTLSGFAGMDNAEICLDTKRCGVNWSALARSGNSQTLCLFLGGGSSLAIMPEAVR